MGIFLLHLYLLCCVHGQDTSDYSGDEEYEPGYDMTGLGRCFKHQYWCLKKYEWVSGKHLTYGQLTIDEFGQQVHYTMQKLQNCFHDVVPWNLHNERADDFGVCIYCPAGSYREPVPDVDIRNIGEKDLTCTLCGANQLSTGINRGENKGATARCGSCGMVFALADATLKSLYGLDQAKNYQQASIMAVTNINNQKICKFCDKSTHFNVNTDSCTPCPPGMMSATPFDPPSSFIPPSVQLANPVGVRLVTDYENAHFPPAADFIKFGCRACDTTTVRRNGDEICTVCGGNEYEIETRVDIQGHINALNGQGFFNNLQLYLGTDCGNCPPGYEFSNRNQPLNQKCRCRGDNCVNDCCRICGPNTVSDGKKCTNVASTHTTNMPFGATKSNACIKTDSNKRPEILRCPMETGDCEAKNNGVGWRTCQECDNTKDESCKACSETHKSNLPILYWDSNLGKCSECSVCEELTLSKTSKFIDGNYFDDRDTKQAKLRYERAFEDFISTTKFDGTETVKYYNWVRTVVTARCTALARRNINKGAQIKSEDMYRRAGTMLVARVPDFHTIHRRSQNVPICTMIRCDAVCTEFFQHSPGCGQQEIRVENIFVEHQGVVAKFTIIQDQLPAVDQQNSNAVNITHGDCIQCTACDKGYFNGKCNVYTEAHLPNGYCKECQEKCPPEEFMYHSKGEAACHVPAESLAAGKNKWQIKEDYECQQCPTWVLATGHDKAQTISTVSACGNRKTYLTYKWDETSQLQSGTKNVDYTKNQRDLLVAMIKPSDASVYKNFRHFHRDLVPYCPEAYYYNEKEEGCNLAQDSLAYVIPENQMRVTIGYNQYRPACCQPCTICGNLQKKDTANWKACGGNSLVDTQNKCVDRCGAMYWENQTAKTCNQCATCQQGFLDTENL